MNTKLNRLIGLTTLILFIFLKVSAVMDDDSTNFWNTTDAPGSFNDPLKAITLYSPSFTIPKLNRFDGIVRGAPQASAGYFVNGSPLFTISDISDLLSLNEQSILPNDLTTTIGTIQVFPVSPFFFDGYRSWFSEQKGMNISTDGSYAPAEYGFFCGPRINIDDNQMLNEKNHLEANFSNYEATVNGMVSSRNNVKLFGSVRSNYNPYPVEKWIKPYSWSGDATAKFPLFANYRIGTIWQPSERFFLKVHLHGALERRSFSTPYEISGAPFESSRKYFVNNASAVAGWKITDAINSSTNIGIGFGFGKAEVSRYINRSARTGTLSLREKIQFSSSNKISPYLGCDFKKGFGNIDDFVLLADPDFHRIAISKLQAQFAPFIGLNSQPVDFITVDGGLRMDKYPQLTEKSSSCFAITPWKAASESTSVDISYRFSSKVFFKENFGVSLSSGLYNQLPSYFELENSKHLRSIKSSRHSIGQFGSFLPCNIAYNVEAYFHQFWDIPGAPTIDQFESNSAMLVSNGILKSKGIEFDLRCAPISIISLLFGYSLSWNDQFNVNTNNWVRADSDHRHKLSTLCELMLPFGLNCATGLIFSSGAPYTPIIDNIYDIGNSSYVPVYNKLNSATGENYLNATVRLSYNRSFRSFSAGFYAEGANLLQNAPDYGHTIWEGYSNDDVPFNIDQRTYAIGIEVKY
jgi:hypothetical protein